MTSSQKSAINVVFGAMTFGKEGAPQVRVTDPKEATSILDVFQKHGHNEVDTARAYGIGSSEAMLGDLKWQDRDLIMATKYNPTAGRAVPDGWRNDERHTPEEIRKNLTDSLARLKADKVDLYYLHQPDRSTRYEVTMKAMNDLHKEGLFRRFGISNYPAWEVAQICEMCKANGWVLPSVYQGVYNAIHRSVEPELFECLRHYQIAFYAYNPLGGGYLTDRYHRSDQQVEQGARFSAESWQGRMYRARYWHEEYFDALDVIRPAAKKHGLTEAECALRWMNHHSKLKRELGDAIIIGASNVHHIESNMDDLDKGPLPEEVVKALDQAWEKCKGISLKYWH